MEASAPERRPSGIDTQPAPIKEADAPADARRNAGEFEALLRAHDSAVRSVAARLVGGDVDDVLQMAYLKAFVAWPEFRGDSAFSTWLHRIVYRCAVDHLRARQRRSILHLRGATTDPGPDLADASNDKLLVEAALQRLPVHHRVVLLLVDVQQLSHEEVAAVLDVAPGTVASRVHRARRAITTILEKG